MRRLGFTIVEMVVVVILLGILAATALPRFFSVQDNAHEAAVQTTIGAFQTSLTQARSVWVLKANGKPAENLAVFDTTQNGQIDFNSSGWPSQQWFGALEANPSTNNVADCISVANALLNTSVEIASSAAADYQPTYLGAGRCRYNYTHTSGLSFDYDSNTGALTPNF